MKDDLKDFEEEDDEPKIKPLTAKEMIEKSRAKTRPYILLPTGNRLISEFAEELAEHLKDKHEIFFSGDSDSVIEVKQGKTLTSFESIIPARFVSYIEKHVTPYVVKVTGKNENIKFENIPTSMLEKVAKNVLNSEVFQKGLLRINKVIQVQIPVLHEGELTFPKDGYDERFKTWLPLHAPKIANTNMPLEEAKKIIEKLTHEFCFEDNIDKTNAIAGFVTPFLMGLSQFNGVNNFRCPIWIYEANRERTGKDYLAGITSIIHEGIVIEESPIATGKVANGNNEELRKIITSTLIQGRQRLHFSNNRGVLDNSVLEGAITNPHWSGRILGRNKMLSMNNDIIFSISGNTPIKYSADIENRARKVYLFLGIENANDRRFSTPYLHEWVLKNRGEILSAFYSLVKNWIDNGCPPSKHNFSSFKEWGRICGGTMENAGYGSPCASNKKKELGGDTDTTDMKYLFEVMSGVFGGKAVKMPEIVDKITTLDLGIFSYIEWHEKKGTKWFSEKLNTFVGRTLSHIELTVNKEDGRTRDRFYYFRLNEESLVLEHIRTHGKITKEEVSNKKISSDAIENLKVTSQIFEFLDCYKITED